MKWKTPGVMIICNGLYKRKKEDSEELATEIEFHNPFDRGSFVNCADSCVRPCMMQATNKGRIFGADGFVRAIPSDTFHDYYKLLPDDMTSETLPRTPGVMELLSMKQSGSHHKYEKLHTDDSAV